MTLNTFTTFYGSKDQTFLKLQTPQPVPTDPSQQNLQDK